MQISLNKKTAIACCSNQYIKSLHKQGYRVVGTGFYSNVYGKKYTNHVIKVGHTRYKDPIDDAYLSFIRMVANSKNPHFPKVLGFSLYKAAGTYWYAVKLEKLVPFFKVPYKKRKDRVFHWVKVSSYEEESQREYITWNPNRSPKRCKFEKDAYNTLYALFRRHNDDLHENNIMWRKQSNSQLQLVITDPAC